MVPGCCKRPGVRQSGKRLRCIQGGGNPLRQRIVHSHWITCALTVALVSPWAHAEDLGGPPEGLAACERSVRERPGDYFPWICFDALARDGDATAIARSLENRLQIEPEDPWLRLMLGLILRRSDADRAERLIRAGAEGFAERGASEEEAQARFLLGRFFRRRFRQEEGVAQFEKAADLAQAAGADGLSILARSEKCKTWILQGRLAEAWFELKRMEQQGAANLDRRIASNFHSALANGAISLNLDEQALH